jgi:Sap, sulfolipid-1-addressing protein
MTALLTSVVPLAIGAAISPTLLALQLLVLTGRNRPLARAWALAAGAALVLAAFIAAALMAALALRSLLKRPTPAEQQKSRTAGRLETAPTGWFVGVGALGMVVNFSTLVLFLPALHEITRSSVDLVGRSVAFGLLFVIALLPVLAPVVVVSVAGERAAPALDATHGFVTRHARQIGIVIEVVFAVYLVIKGVAELP